MKNAETLAGVERERERERESGILKDIAIIEYTKIINKDMIKEKVDIKKKAENPPAFCFMSTFYCLKLV